MSKKRMIKVREAKQEIEAVVLGTCLLRDVIPGPGAESR